MRGLSIWPLFLGCPPSSLCTRPGPPSPSWVFLLHKGLEVLSAAGLLPPAPTPTRVSRGQACPAYTLGPGNWSLGSASCCPQDPHLCPCLWGAALSPGRARGCCISATPLGSPSSWPLSLRLGSRGQGPVGRGAGPLHLSGEGSRVQACSGQMGVVGSSRAPTENWSPIPGGRDARDHSPPTPSGIHFC